MDNELLIGHIDQCMKFNNISERDQLIYKQYHGIVDATEDLLKSHLKKYDCESNIKFSDYNKGDKVVCSEIIYIKQSNHAALGRLHNLSKQSIHMIVKRINSIIRSYEPIKELKLQYIGE